MSATTVIEGVEIPDRLIADEAQHHPQGSAAEARLAAGRALAVKALLLNRAAELGLKATPQLDEAGREETGEEALIRALLESEIEIATPTEAECRRVYDARLAPYAAAPPFEAARTRIAEGLERRAWLSAAAKYVADLAADARGRGVALSLVEEGAPRAGSITLGGLMADALGDRLSAWLAACDPALAEKAAAAASAQDLAAEEFVRATFRAFVETANDEAWTRAISAAQGAGDPAFACLTAVLKAKLEPARAFRTVLRRA
jgi:peptidyl-prolyl cis-trans isomerase C